MAAIARTCVSCNLPYDPYEAGSWLCYWHPGKRSSTTFHLECCGVSPSNDVCKSHVEPKNEGGQGCHRADHVASDDERQSLHQRPFSISPLSQISSMRHLTRPDNKKIFHFDSLANMPKSLAIRVPDTWGAGKTVTQGLLHVNLEEEQRKLQEALFGASSSIQKTDDPYGQQWDIMNGVEQTDVDDFVPFVLFLRVDPEIDTTKKKQLDEFVEQHSCT